MILSRRQPLHQRLRQLVQISVQPAHRKAGLRAGSRVRHPAVHHASGAGQRRIAQNAHSAGLQQRGNRAFLLLLRQHGHGALKVGHGIERAAAGHNGHAYAVHIGVQHVGAVMRRVHPCIVNCGRIGANRHVLLDQAEVRAGLFGALAHIRLAHILMRD